MDVTEEYSSRSLDLGPGKELQVEQGHPQCPGLVVLALSWEAGTGKVVSSPAPELQGQ